MINIHFINNKDIVRWWWWITRVLNVCRKQLFELYFFIIYLEENIQFSVLILNDMTADLHHIRYSMLKVNIFKIQILISHCRCSKLYYIRITIIIGLTVRKPLPLSDAHNYRNLSDDTISTKLQRQWKLYHFKGRWFDQPKAIRYRE